MISIIINPVSGGATLDQGHRRADLAATLLERTGRRGTVVLTQRRGHGHELAAAAIRRGEPLVIAWGGDGTVNEVGSALVRSDTALGIVPSGSGNGLARELGIPVDPTRALLRAFAAAPRTIDAGELGGRWFFSIAGMGFDAHVAAAFDRAGGRRGLVTYARLTARALWEYRSGRYSVDGADPVTALLVTVANSAQFGNGARIAPGAKLDDGQLDLVVFEESSRFATVRGLPHLFTGRVGRVRGVSIRQLTRVTIDSETPMIFHVDGEPVQGGTRLEARVHPGVLRVAG
jgi:YegS/Rv2252/BmrU family lipid kinase